MGQKIAKASKIKQRQAKTHKRQTSKTRQEKLAQMSKNTQVLKRVHCRVLTRVWGGGKP
jgi:NifU-like protein involved in Fe-S cluster formation